MRNISTAVRSHYDDDRYIWAIIIRRFCDKDEECGYDELAESQL
jgi:hypothetical protein